jgi:hypothetical protein
VRRSALASALLAVLSVSALRAEGGASAERSPYPLPAEESFVYSRTVGGKLDTVEMRMRLVSDKGASWYELAIRSPDQEGTFRLDPGSLFATFSDVTTRSADSTIRRVTTVVENRALVKDGEILVSGTESLGQSLRLFPWGKRQKVKLVFLGGAGAGGFSFELSVAGREKVRVGGREIECWKAQLGLGGIFGGVFAKTSLWYTVDYPHYMAKSEGPAGPPGSPVVLMELLSYAAGP